MNIELLKKVKQHIIERPERFIMGRWRLEFPPGTTVAVGRYDGMKRKVPECGTMACIAGWACALGDPKNNVHGTFGERAANLLVISDDLSYSLFQVDGWSPYFQKLWRSTKSPKKHAEIAGRVIDRFVKKHG